MNKVQKYIGDKKWMNEPGRPDDTDFRAAIDLLEQIQAENKILKELLDVAICPNAMNGCKDGTLINPYGETEQCQWCNMTKRAIEGE